MITIYKYMLKVLIKCRVDTNEDLHLGRSVRLSKCTTLEFVLGKRGLTSFMIDPLDPYSIIKMPPEASFLGVVLFVLVVVCPLGGSS